MPTLSNPFTVTPAGVLSAPFVVTPLIPGSGVGFLQYLTFFSDDTTTIDGAVLAAGAVPSVAQTTCGTGPDHARPALLTVLEGLDATIDIVQASAAIGALAFYVQDNRRTADQATGWLTNILSDVNGQTQLMGQRLSFKQVDQYGTEYNIDLLITDIELQDNKTTYKITTRDMRERERTLTLFYSAEQVVVWPSHLWDTRNTGLRDGYGYSNPGDPSRLLLKPSGGVKAVFRKWAPDPNVPAGLFEFDSQPYIDLGSGGPKDWDVLIRPYNIYTDGVYLPATATALGTTRSTAKLTGMIVEWRPWGSSPGFPWTQLRNMPEWGNNTTPTLGPWLPGFLSGVLKGDTSGNMQALLRGVQVTWDDMTLLPTDGQVIEVRVLSGLPPSETTPFYFEGTFGQFLKNCYDGVYSSSGVPAIRYNAAVMADLVIHSPILRLIKTNSEAEGLVWLQENWYKPMRMIPLINEAGEIVPTSYDLPDPSVAVTVLDNTNVEAADWSHGSADAVNAIEFTYKRDYLDVHNSLQSIDVHADRLNAPGIVRVGQRTLKLAPETVRDVTFNINASYGRAETTDLGYYLQLQISAQLLNRLNLGGQRLIVKALRFDPAVRALKAGQWVQVTLSWPPDYVTKLRGIDRLMQVMHVKDTSPILREFTLLDAGPFDQPLAAPLAGDISMAMEGPILKVTGANTPAGVFLRVDVASAASPPNPGSPAWVNLGRTIGPGTVSVRSRALPAGNLFVRVRYEKTARRPSGWTQAGTFDMPVVLYVAVQQRVLPDGTRQLAWPVNPAVGGLRVFYTQITHGAADPGPLSGTHLDIDASLGTAIIPGVIPQWYDSVVEIVAYPGFAGGVVTGVGGGQYRIPNATRVNDPGIMPTTEVTSSYAGGVGTLHLDVNDPELRVIKAQFKKRIGLIGFYGPWVDDLTLPYETTVTVPPGEASWVQWRVVAYDVRGSVVVLGGTEIAFVDPAAGAILNPVARITAGDDSDNLVALYELEGDVGVGGSGPLEYRYRVTRGALPPSWSAWTATPALPVEISITRDGSRSSLLEFQVRQADGKTGNDHVTVPQRYGFFTIPGGVPRRGVPFDDGGYPATATNTTGMGLHPSVQEGGGKAVNRLYAKALAGDADSLDSVQNGISFGRTVTGALTSGQVDLGMPGVINKHGNNIVRSGADGTLVASILVNVTNAGHLGTPIQDGNGRLVTRALAKTLAADPDTLDSVIDGLSYGKASYTRLGYADTSGLLASIGAGNGQNMLENGSFELAPVSAAGDGFALDWATLESSGAWTLTRENIGADAWVGSYVAKLSIPAGSDLNTYGAVHSRKHLQIIPGASYVLRARINAQQNTAFPAGGTASATIFLRVYYSDATFLDFSATPVSGVNSVWAPVEALLTVPVPVGKIISYGVMYLTASGTGATALTVGLAYDARFDEISLAKVSQADLDLIRSGADQTPLGTVLQKVTNNGDLSADATQVDGSQNRVLAKGTQIRDYADGDVITFAPAFTAAPAVSYTPLLGSVTYQPDAAQWSGTYDSTKSQGQDVGVASLSGVGGTLRAKLRQQGGSTANNFDFPGGNMTALGNTKQIGPLTGAPSSSNHYTVRFTGTVTATYTGPLSPPGSRTIYVTVQINRRAGGPTGASTELDRRTYTSTADIGNSPNVVDINEVIDLYSAAIGATDYLELKIFSVTSTGSSGSGSFSIHGNINASDGTYGLTFLTGGADRFASMTPTGAKAIRVIATGYQ